jgi:hypothetical protein
MTLRKLMLTSVTAAAFCSPMLASADSSSGVGAASADLDFQIVIDDYVFLQIGSASPTVDLIGFNIDGVTNLSGDASTIAGSTTVAVTLNANADNVTLDANSVGALTGPGAVTIPWSDITIATDGTGTGDIPVPTIDGADSTGLDPSATSGTLSDVWRFEYSNDTYYDPGTYGTGGAGGGATVTFTATAL